jgi:hypothetical protein
MTSGLPNYAYAATQLHISQDRLRSVCGFRVAKRFEPTREIKGLQRNTNHSTQHWRNTAVCYLFADEPASWLLERVPSGKWLEFGAAISGNMKVSFQAARSIG